MAINSQLLKFKSPGTKILTEISENTPQAAMPTGSRILVINSRKGEVNRAIQVYDWDHYRSMFDDISDADERRGNFSALSAFYMLEVAPIWVINLRSFDDKIDKAGYQELSTTLNIRNAMSKDKPYSSLFDTSQFWKIDPEELISNQNIDKLLVFGNIGNSNMSIIVRKSRTNQSTLTLDTWYKNLNREIPSYVYPEDKVADWMVDVYMFENSFSAGSSSNSRYGYCFDNAGNIKTQVVNNIGNNVDGLDQLTMIPESGFVGVVTGSLIQGFVSDVGNDMDIVTLMNGLVSQTGIVCSRNDSIFDTVSMWYSDDTPNSNGMKQPIPVDFKGHSLCNISQVGTFSKTSLISDVRTGSYNYQVELETVSNTSEELITQDSVEVLPKATVLEMPALLYGNKVGNEVHVKDKSKIIVKGDVLKPTLNSAFAGFDGNLASVTSVRVIGSSFKIYDANSEVLAIQPVTEFENFVDGTKDFVYAGAGKAFPKASNGDYFVYPTDHPLKGLPVVFEKLDSNGKAINVVHNPDTVTAFVMSKNSPFTVEEMETAITDVDDYTPTTVEYVALTDIDLDLIKDHDADVYATLVSDYSTTNNVYEVSFDKDLVFNKSDEDLEVEFEPNVFDEEVNELEFRDGSKVTVYQDELFCFRIFNADASTEFFVPLNLKSYKMRNAQFLDGTRERQNSVLDVLLSKSLRNALQNRDLITWNYIVDGFKTFIEPNAKNQTKIIAEDRIIGRSIYSMPSIRDFSKSTNPYFSDSIGGPLEIKYIPQGGNLELPYNNTFSLPSNNGWYAYGYGPNLKISGTTKTIPPAAIISNLYQMKYIDGKPYKILAGSDGMIRFTGISGVEHVFNETNDGLGDRDYLDPFGYNVIVNKSNGLQVYGNKTSNNTVSTPVSSIHTSEVLMFIQERINNLLENYVFKLNNRQNRLIIKEQADQICDEPRSEGAIFDYVNQMDESNNTQEIVANRYGILDTTIYDQNGMEILVHRTKIDSISNAATFEVIN